MSFESYRQMLLAQKDICLRKDRAYTLSFELEDAQNADRIFFTGETGIFYQWKNEPDYQYLYRRIDDSLTSEEANRDRFALDMSAKHCDYPKIAYKKLLWPPRFYPHESNSWSFGISVKAENLSLEENGYLHFLLEARYKKTGVQRNVTYTEPDFTHTIDIPCGSYDWQELCATLEFPSYDLASICLYLEGENYDGKVFFEAPSLKNQQGHELCSDFSPFIEDRVRDKMRFNWLGVNLSKVETPSLRVELNGSVIYEGEIFERCHRYSEWEIKLPRGVAVNGKNSLGFTLTSSFRDAPPYNLHEVGVIFTKCDMLVSCPETVTVGKPFHLMLKTESDGISFALENAPDCLSAVTELFCHHAGLNVLSFVCTKAANNISFTLKHSQGELECNISRCVERQDDDVITGTGDMVYIGQSKDSFEDYLCWYLSNNIGNMLTIRPTYRWCGTRAANGELWRSTADLLARLDIDYVHMLDGRELQGCDANPLPEELDTAHFLGRQSHEFDGQYVYWGLRDITGNLNEEMFYDLFMRRFATHGRRMNTRYCPQNYITKNGRTALFCDMTVRPDMEAVANATVAKLNATRFDCTRHTGPATLFKYFYQAGYKWTGAELMYTSTEVTCAALRGAASVYGGKLGGHLATQWSSTPYDEPEHAKRYRLALYISYMQGLHHINTEEGLWHLEEYYLHAHRYSTECLAHLKEQQEFYRYISAHSRQGSFYTPIAFLNGRFDGWRVFGAKNNTWGRSDFKHFDAEESWDALDVYYPESKSGALYFHPCPRDREVGYYSGTPMGSVDILPIEANSFNYRLLVAIGYNKAICEDMDKLYGYVKQGGKLLLGLPQLSSTTLRKDIESYNMAYIDHPMRHTIAPHISFVSDTLDGKPINVSLNLPEGAEVIYTTDSGRALLFRLNIGKGCVYLLNTREYIGCPALYDKAKQIIAELSAECFAEEKVWAEGDEAVQFAVYEQADRSRHIYFISADWYAPETPLHKAYLRIDGNRYPLCISYGRMLKAVVKDGVGAWFDEEENDVLSIDGSTVKVQGTGTGRLFLAKDGKLKELDLDFTSSSIQNVKI